MATWGEQLIAWVASVFSQYWHIMTIILICLMALGFVVSRWESTNAATAAADAKEDAPKGRYSKENPSPPTKLLSAVFSLGAVYRTLAVAAVTVGYAAYAYWTAPKTPGVAAQPLLYMCATKTVDVYCMAAALLLVLSLWAIATDSVADLDEKLIPSRGRSHQRSDAQLRSTLTAMSQTMLAVPPIGLGYWIVFLDGSWSRLVAQAHGLGWCMLVGVLGVLHILVLLEPLLSSLDPECAETFKKEDAKSEVAKSNSMRWVEATEELLVALVATVAVIIWLADADTLVKLFERALYTDRVHAAAVLSTWDAWDISVACRVACFAVSVGYFWSRLMRLPPGDLDDKIDHVRSNCWACSFLVTAYLADDALERRGVAGVAVGALIVKLWLFVSTHILRHVFGAVGVYVISALLCGPVSARFGGPDSAKLISLLDCYLLNWRWLGSRLGAGAVAAIAWFKQTPTAADAARLLLRGAACCVAAKWAFDTATDHAADAPWWFCFPLLCSIMLFAWVGAQTIAKWVELGDLWSDAFADAYICGLLRFTLIYNFADVVAVFGMCVVVYKVARGAASAGHDQAAIRGAVARATAAVTAVFADAVHRVRNAAALRRRAQQNRERVERERRADAAARELLGDAAPRARPRAPVIAESVPVWARVLRVLVCCLCIVVIHFFVNYDDVPFPITTSKTFDTLVFKSLMSGVLFCIWKGIQAVSGFAAGRSSWHCGVVADVCLPIVLMADFYLIYTFAFLGACAFLYESYSMLRCLTTRQADEREDAPIAESSPAPRESTTGGRPRRRRRQKPQTPTTRPAVAVAAPPTARAPMPPPAPQAADADAEARVILVPGGRVALPALPAAPAPAPSKAAPKGSFNRKARRAAAAAARASALASTERIAADPEVAALLKRLGLERLELTFAREQIEAEALQFVSVDDLLGIGVPADDASRIVAAASASATASGAAATTSGGDHPESLCCPISMELMECPVMAADGNTYDRSSIEDWFSRGKKTSPLTGAPLAHLGLTPNNLVRSMVSEYRDASSRA